MAFNKKNVRLPRWAKLIQPKEDNIVSRELQDSPDDDEIEEEEIYIRKRCYHILSGQMKRSMQGALDDCLASSLSTLEDFLDAAAPSPPLPSSRGHDEQQPPSRKKQKINYSPSPPEEGGSSGSISSSPPVLLEGLDTELFDQEQRANASHDPLLLPVIMVEGPSFGTDRRLQMGRLANNLQRNRPRSAVVPVHLSSSSLQHRNFTNNNNNKGMQELVRQCHCLSPVLSGGPLYRRIVKRKKKRACSFSDLLLLWAQHVTDFNEICLFLNADECFYSDELREFLHILATKRSEQGIPLIVVMLGPPEGRRHIELKSTLQGYAGLMIRSIALPSCESILDCFWKRLWIHFPILFPPTVLKTMEKSFLYYSKSCHRTFYKLQQVLAYRFVKRGSFLSVAHHPAIMNEIWQRLAWFLASQDGRRYLLLGDQSSEDVTSTQMYTALETIYSQNQNAHLSLQLISSLHSYQVSSLLVSQPGFSKLFRKRSRRDLLEALVKLRASIHMREDHEQEHATAPTCHKLFTKYVSCESLESAGQLANNQAKRQFSEKQRFINELIILVGNCRDGDDLSEIEVLLNEVLGVWMRRSTDHEIEMKQIIRTEQSDVLSFHSKKGEVDPASEWWREALDSLASEPRRQIVKALVGVPEAWEWAKQASRRGKPDRKHPPLAHIAGIMYRLIHDRVAVTQEDWFEEFSQTAIVDVGATCPREESFVLFSLGLRYLKQCGLIVEKLRVGSRSDIIYERAKLVWCASYDE